jgi:hypothetical protein
MTGNANVPASDPADPQGADQAATVEAPSVLGKLSWPTLIAAAVLLLFFLVLSGVMFFGRLTLADLEWSRAMTIYSAIEAFALAAAGALFGTQIQAGRVANAERRADHKDKEASRAKEQAATSKSELGGHRRKIEAARAQLAKVEAAAERGGGGAGTAETKARELGILRGILEQGEA